MARFALLHAAVALSWAAAPAALADEPPDAPPEPAVSSPEERGGSEQSAEPSSSAEGRPRSSGGAVGPLLTDEILHRYDLDGDGTVDEVEAAIAQTKLRRRRSEKRLAEDIDPVTDRPRRDTDPTTRSGFRPGPPPADGVPPGAREGRDLGAAASRGSDETRGTPRDQAQDRRRLLDLLDGDRGGSPGASAGAGGGAGGSARSASAPGRSRPEPLGWVPGGDGTLFRGGSYPLPDGRRSGSSSARGGVGGGMGPLLPGSAATTPRGGSTAAPPRGGQAGGSSRVTFPQSSRGSRGSGSPPPSGGR